MQNGFWHWDKYKVRLGKTTDFLKPGWDGALNSVMFFNWICIKIKWSDGAETQQEQLYVKVLQVVPSCEIRAKRMVKVMELGQQKMCDEILSRRRQGTLNWNMRKLPFLDIPPLYPQFIFVLGLNGFTFVCLVFLSDCLLFELRWSCLLCFKSL